MADGNPAERGTHPAASPDRLSPDAWPAPSPLSEPARPTGPAEHSPAPPPWAAGACVGGAPDAAPSRAAHNVRPIRGSAPVPPGWSGGQYAAAAGDALRHDAPGPGVLHPAPDAGAAASGGLNYAAQ